MFAVYYEFDTCYMCFVPVSCPNWDIILYTTKRDNCMFAWGVASLSEGESQSLHSGQLYRQGTLP